MKTSEAIKLLQEELKRHSGEDEEPVPVSGIGWYGHVEKNLSATFLECAECHHEGIAEKCEAESMADIDEPLTLDELDSL